MPPIQPPPRGRFNPIRRIDRSRGRDFRNPGAYTPFPGRGPYNWRNSAGPVAVYDFSGAGWVAAPSESHLQDFRIVYGLDHQGTVQTSAGYKLFVRVPDETFLQVRFKDGGWAVYWTDGSGAHDADRLETIFLMMESDPHPGTLIWKELISDQWPYDTSAS